MNPQSVSLRVLRLTALLSIALLAASCGGGGHPNHRGDDGHIGGAGMRGARSGVRKPKTDRPRRGMFRRKRVCRFCVDKIPYIDYKDVRMLIASIPDDVCAHCAFSASRL